MFGYNSTVLPAFSASVLFVIDNFTANRYRFMMESTVAEKDQGAVFAKSPFHHPDGDIIIRSSDGIHFRMMKLLLSLASPIFKDMFSLPRSADENIDEFLHGLPIVDLTESSRTIENLLSSCYPAIYGKTSGLQGLSDVSALLEAAKKYEMEETGRAVVPFLTKPQFLAQEPLRVFAIACRYKLDAEAILAAKHTLHRSILEDKYSQESEMIDGGTLYRVLQYRNECAEAAMKVAKIHTWIKSDYYAFFDCRNQDEDRLCTDISSPPSRKYKHGYDRGVSVHIWWMEYMESTRVALQTATCGETVRDLIRVGPAFAAANKCSTCRLTVAADFRQFVDEFAKEVDDRISMVQYLSPHFFSSNFNKISAYRPA